MSTYKRYRIYLDFIKSTKLFLYFTSMAPVLLAFCIAGFKSAYLFILLLLLVIFVQLMINISMDLSDFKAKINVRSANTFFPIGPYSISIMHYRIKSLKLAATISIIVAVIDGIIVLIVTREYILLLIGFIAVLFSALYIVPPVSLYRRGVGEISTFLNFGPLPLLGSLIAFHNPITLQYITISIFLGLMASAIRYLHHLPEDNMGSIRVRKFKIIYSSLVFIGTILPIFAGVYLIVILLIPAVWHIIKLPGTVDGISRKTFEIVLLHITGTLLILLQLSLHL
ncbi:MAG: prenyltransferase [Thermoplasmata archaeon]